MSATNKQDAENAKLEGNKAFQMGDFERALQCYTKAIQLDPDNHLYYSNRAAVYMKQKKYENAANDSKKCIELKPNFAKGYWRLGNAAIALNDFISAEAVFKKGLEYDPDNKDLKKALETAKKKYQEFLEIQRKKDNLIKRIGTLRGEIRVDLEVNNLYYERLARDICNNKLKIDYDEIVSAVIRAKKEKDPEKKLLSLCAENKMLKTALKVSKALTYFVVSCVMFQSGFLDVADKYVKKCLEIDSKNVDCWILLTHIDLYHSEGKNAIKYVKKALELQNDHLLAAKTYLELISNQEAPTQLEQQKELLKDLTNIMNNAEIPREWAVEIGLRIWFVMVNITPGAIQQLREVMDYQLDEKASRMRTLKIFNSHTTITQPLITVCLEEFILLALRSSIVTRQDAELFFTRVRSCIIYVEPGNLIVDMIPLYYAMAHQCYLTNWSWAVKDEEQIRVNEMISKAEELLEKIESNQKKWIIDEKLHHYLLFISMYQPLNLLRGASKLVEADRSKLSYPFALLLRYHIVEFFEEQRINVKSISPISEGTPQKMAEFYKTLISPRWKHCAPPIVRYPVHKEVEWLYPNKYWPKGFEKKGANGDVTRILYLGCGTGKDLGLAASKYENVHVVGVDCCLERLNYAARQLNELEIKNVKVLHGDLMNLDISHFGNIQFDLINAGYLLGMVDNPVAGGQVLVKLLRPGGILKASFFTPVFVDVIKVARHYLDTCRSEGKFSSEPIFDTVETGMMPKVIRNPTAAEKRKARELVLENPKLKPLIMRYEFYNLDLFADTLFNPHIIGMSFMELGKLIKDLDLKFITFEHLSQKLVEEYGKEHSLRDPNIEDFSLLDQFAKKNPSLFKNSIHFICEKKQPVIQTTSTKDPLNARMFLQKFAK